MKFTCPTKICAVSAGRDKLTRRSVEVSCLTETGAVSAGQDKLAQKLLEMNYLVDNYQHSMCWSRQVSTPG